MSLPHWLQNRTIQAALAMVLTLGLLVATEPQVGLTWDEPIYMEASERYVSWLGQLVTQPGTALSREGIDKTWSFNHEHPPLAKVYSGMVWSVARFFLNDLTAHRLGNMILVSILVGLLYLLVAGSYGLWAGCGAALALLTMPRFFFHAHLAALDVPAACAVFFLTFVFWKTKDNPSWKWTIVLGLLWGLALATKFYAIFVPYVFLLWVILFHRRRMLLVRGFVITLIGFPFSFAIWPWIYPDIPGRVWNYLGWVTIAHPKIGQWYLGEIHMPPPWHFPFVLMLAIVPLTLTVLYIIGMVRAGRNGREADRLGVLLVLLVLVPLVGLASGQSMVYDQDRIFMPVFPFLAALAGIGFGWLVMAIRRGAERFQRPRWAVPVTGVAFLLVLLPQSIGLIRLYPHLLSYYSEAVGGLPGATRLGMETTYWCESYAAAIPYLNEHAKPGDMIWVDPLSQNVMVYYQVHGRLRRDVKIAYSSFAPYWPFIYPGFGPPTVADDASSDLIVLQYRQTLMGSTPEKPDRQFYSPHPDFEWASTHQPLFRLSHDGVPIMDIYSNPKAKTAKVELSDVVVEVPVDFGLFKPKAGGFTVRVPQDVTLAESILDVDTGDPVVGKLKLHIYEGSADGKSSYMLHYFDLPTVLTADPSAAQGLLHAVRDRQIKDSEGKLIAEREIALGAYPGGEALVDAKQRSLPVRIKARNYLVRGRYYQISISVPKDGIFSTEMEAFLQSFALAEDS